MPPLSRDPALIAARFLDERELGCRQVSGSGNACVYRIDSKKGPFALKLYPTPDDDPRPRMAHEKAALELIGRHAEAGLRAPRFLQADPGAGAALMSWLDGAPALPVQAGDFIRLAEIAGRLLALSEGDDADAMPDSIGATLSAQALFSQLEGRLALLEVAARKDARLEQLLRSRLRPLFDLARGRSVRLYERGGLDPARRLSRFEAVLSPSDFGLHNALRDPGGALWLVDFEYFGWDDPVRLVVDLALHPAMALDSAQRVEATARLGAPFLRDPAFALRLEALSPLIAVRWALIVLNEFLPNVWRRRQAAGQLMDWEKAKVVQLSKAANLLTLAAEFLSEA